MKENYYYIAFSGNRPKEEKGRRVEDIDSKRDELEAVLLSLKSTAVAKGAIPVLITGVAAGADTLACEVGWGIGLRIHLVFSFPFQKDRVSFVNNLKEGFVEYDSEIWNRTDRLISKLLTKPLMVERLWLDNNSGEQFIHKRVNDLLLSKANVLVTLTNGKVTGKKGGASDFAMDAKAAGVEVIEICT